MSKHVVIVGGGVIGLCAAYYCQRRGHRVTVIERNGESRDGCSFGNAGMVVPSHFVPLAAPGMVALGLKWMANPRSPFYIQPRLSWDLLLWGFRFWQASTKRRVERAAPILRDLNLASRACFEELSKDLPANFGLATHGLVVLCKTKHTLDEEAKTAETSNRLGIPAEVHDPASLARLEPGVQMDVAGGVYFPKDCHLDPRRFVSAVQSRLQQEGAEFRWNENVLGFRRDKGSVVSVSTSAGEVQGDEFVLAAGSWSTGVARDLGLSLPLQPGKGYSLTLPNPRRSLRLCAILAEARVAVTPMGESLRFGGTMEMSGLNEEIRPLRVQGIIDSVPGYFPEFQPSDFAGIQPWRGLRPCSPDGLPYLGRPRSLSNVIVATGHAMMGLSLGPVTGDLVGQIVDSEKPRIDLGLLSPDRYA